MNPNKKYKYAVVIGRFEPAHNAHLGLFEKALELADKLIVVLGSHDAPRSIKNPWTSQERADMIVNSIYIDSQHRVRIAPVCDTMYSDSEWVASVHKAVENVTYDGTTDDEIVLVTHDKDETTYYINYFKQWDIVDVAGTHASDNGPALSATKIRELYFEGYMNLIAAACPPNVVEYLKEFRNTEAFETLLEEYRAAEKYDLQYQNVPYGQTNFLTVDAVVVQSGHVLLVKRGQSPGKGLWALPGGHLNINETFLQGAIRELKEETMIKVPDKVLKGSIFYDHIFDHPDRSLRGRLKKKIGRTVTRAYGFKLDDLQELPKVKGADDAQDAWWFTFGEIEKMRSQMFEDHYDIVKHFLARL